MYPLISKWYILPGKEEETLTALRALAHQVAEEEEGTLAYLVHTSDTGIESMPAAAKGEVVFFEIYRDKDAFEAHVNGPRFKDFVQQYGGNFRNAHGAPFATLHLLHHRAGFIRAGILD